MTAQRFLISTLSVLALSGAGSGLHAQDEGTKVLDLNQMDMEEVEDNWDSTRPATQINPNSNLRIKDIVEPTSDYTYASFGKPDPFTMPPSLLAPPPSEALLSEDGEPIPPGGPVGKEITITSPLQAYPLSSLIVRGVWQTAEGEFRAVIQTPKKEGIVVKDGDPISSGKVLGIGKDSILVRLYKLRKDGVREYDDSRMTFGEGAVVTKETIKLEPGKEAQFPGMENPAESAVDDKGTGAVVPVAKGAGPPPGFINPDEAPAAAAPPAANPAAAPQAPAVAPAAPAAGNQPLGWPYNTGAAPAAPAPTSGRPGATVQ